MNGRGDRALAATALCALVAGLLACGCGEPERGVPVLKFATYFGTREAKDMQPIIAAINARHAREFRVEMMTIPDAYLTKIDTMMSAHMAPDLLLLDQEVLVSYAAIGAVLDLDSRIRADRSIDLADYYPAAIETSTYRGHLYSLPFVMMPVVMYYNQSLFEAARLAFPDATWDQARFIAAARQLTRKDPANPGRTLHWGFLQYTWPPYHIWVWQNGGDILSHDRKRPTFDDPLTIQGLEFMDGLINADQVSPDCGTISQLGVNELFCSGRIAMFFGGASDENDHTPGLRVGVTELPRGRQRATFSWIGHLVVSSRTAHPDLAYVAWRELLEGFHNWKIVAPRRSLAKRMARILPRKAYAKDAILASMEYARGIPGIAEQTEWNEFVNDKLLMPIFRGELPASRAAAATQAKLEQLLEVAR